MRCHSQTKVCDTLNGGYCPRMSWRSGVPGVPFRAPFVSQATFGDGEACGLSACPSLLWRGSWRRFPSISQCVPKEQTQLSLCRSRTPTGLSFAHGVVGESRCPATLTVQRRDRRSATSCRGGTALLCVSRCLAGGQVPGRRCQVGLPADCRCGDNQRVQHASRGTTHARERNRVRVECGVPCARFPCEQGRGRPSIRPSPKPPLSGPFGTYTSRT